MIQNQQARLPLRVVIVGAGIGGASAAVMLAMRGHEVTLLEHVPQLAEVGAGIQISPNMLRIFARIGLREEIEKHCVGLQKIVARRWQDGSLLQATVTGTDSKASNVPKSIHRADLHNIIIDAARALPNITLRLGSRIATYGFDKATACLADGTRIIGDVLVAADGIKSTARKQLLESLGEVDAAAEPTGDATYRIMIPRERMLDDPELRELIESPTATRWIGPNRHVMAYPIKNHELFNVVLIHPDRGDKDEA
ncbi:hypothetical protein KEM56_001773, partial [Ascosphaera pollenicola]